jgi:hypothetical protein
MSLKSVIPNTDNLLSGGTSALNHDEQRCDTVVNDNEPPEDPQFVTVGQERPSRRRHAGGKPRVNFNLAEALRLRSLAYGYRKIARRMNNVSRATVRRRLMEHDARQQAQSPKPVPASAPAQRLPVVPVAPPAPSSTQDSLRSDYRPDWAFVPPSQGVPEPEPKATPVPKVDPVPPPPEPVWNYDQLVDYWAIRGVKNYKPDTKWVFLVNGRKNLEYATGYEQLAVTIDRWCEAYRAMPEFQDAKRIWVVIDRRDDNRAFLMSILNDIWIREKCVISTEGVQTICKHRLLWERANHSAAIVDPAFRLADRLDFETVHHFQAIPQPNWVRAIEKLLEPSLKPPEPPTQVSGGYGAPSGAYPQADNVPPQTGDRGCGFAF